VQSHIALIVAIFSWKELHANVLCKPRNDRTPFSWLVDYKELEGGAVRRQHVQAGREPRLVDDVDIADVQAPSMKPSKVDTCWLGHEDVGRVSVGVVPVVEQKLGVGKRGIIPNTLNVAGAHPAVQASGGPHSMRVTRIALKVGAPGNRLHSGFHLGFARRGLL
jgi:hypothetical protein